MGSIERVHLADPCRREVFGRAARYHGPPPGSVSFGSPITASENPSRMQKNEKKSRKCIARMLRWPSWDVAG